MSLSVASNAAGFGRPLGYVLTGLSAVLPADATPRSGATASWSYAPPLAGAGRHEARLSELMTVLSRLSADPSATATGRSGQETGDAPAPSSGTRPARSDAADLLQALNDTGGAPASSAHLPEQGAPEPDQASQTLAQRPATDVMSRVDPAMQDEPADPSLSAADAQLQALFKTLQEYGL